MNTHQLRSFCLAVCLVFSQTIFVHAHTPADEMAEAAEHFLAALTPEQRAKATFDFQANERENWHFIPRARQGLPFKEMTTAQHKLAHALLSTALSNSGYLKATTIMSLEQVLHDIEKNGTITRDPELYYFSIFGKPGPKQAWGWRVEGHHLSLNLTLAHDVISATPSFFGSNPAEVREGPRHGLRVLADEEDLGFALMKSLDQSQRTEATILTEAPREIVTGNNRHIEPLEKSGLAEAKMNEAQKKILRDLVHAYLFRHRAEFIERDWQQIEKAGWEKVHFAWAGATEPGRGHYYRVQGPTFLLEFDNTQNDANHIHSVWREFHGDFGEDVLKEHYQRVPHAQ